MKTYVRWLSAVTLFAFCGGCGPKSNSVVDSSRIVAYAQPAVFLVEDFGDIEITAPMGATTKKQYATLPASGLSHTSISSILSDRHESSYKDLEARLEARPSPSLLANQFEADRRAGVIEDAKTFAEYGWEKIAEDPGRYLNASDPETHIYEDTCYASGSAFAVSREGYLLTNAHVVSDPGDIPPSRGMVRRPVLMTMEALSQEFGAEPSPEIAKNVLAALADWFRQRAEVKITFKEARIVLDTQRSEFLHLIDSPLSLDGTAVDDPDKKLRDISKPVEIRAIGKVFPGEDVAVIKVEGLRDRLVCLPLGDSDLVQPDTAVRAMGFPGAAIMEGAMTEEANYRVISHEGRIDTRLPMTGGWDGFHMTAEINHGDSGGPVLDPEGRVIGLNVAGNQEKGPAQNIAVPINIAKKYLEQIHLKPRPGPVTEHWIRGQQLFAEKNYKAALIEFEKVDRLQNGLLGFSALGSDTSPYVLEMVRLCCKLGKIDPSDSLKESAFHIN